MMSKGFWFLAISAVVLLIIILSSLISLNIIANKLACDLELCEQKVELLSGEQEKAK